MLGYFLERSEKYPDEDDRRAVFTIIFAIKKYTLMKKMAKMGLKMNHKKSAAKFPQGMCDVYVQFK